MRNAQPFHCARLSRTYFRYGSCHFDATARRAVDWHSSLDTDVKKANTGRGNHHETQPSAVNWQPDCLSPKRLKALRPRLATGLLFSVTANRNQYRAVLSPPKRMVHDWVKGLFKRVLCS
jgi:hypothetical protein